MLTEDYGIVKSSVWLPHFDRNFHKIGLKSIIFMNLMLTDYLEYVKFLNLYNQLKTIKFC
ncbi:hypothetical protein CLV59_109180 [Chitinophaga dinghuensis]|uniref:Uncharacterized protein n=1 Tax=Chitinophaga dinghuensis TaxID=1539050 RepID=A0A327VP73_9BACT|nr:hypothetical protein CLV59_109180 [Chitinophaga dinghuensis]